MSVLVLLNLAELRKCLVKNGARLFLNGEGLPGYQNKFSVVIHEIYLL